MMVVVPGFTKSRNRQDGIVGAAVLQLIRPAAKYMANRINAPGAMVHDQDPYQAAPEEAAPRSHPASGNGALGRSGYDQPQRDPDKIEPVQFEDLAVLQQVPDIRSPIGEFMIEKPSHV